MKSVRASQIVDAFIELVAAHGLEHVSLDDVATKAGVKRAALRHFVGNREDLIDAAITEINRRFMEDFDGTTTFTAVMNRLFSSQRIRQYSAETYAWGVLVPEATRSVRSRGLVKQGWEQLITVIADALRRDHPQASEADIRDTAYAIACLAEQNWNFQIAGLPRARSAAAKSAALTLAAQLP